MKQRSLKPLALILSLFMIFFIFTPVASCEDSNILIDGKGIFIETHGEWQFSQGYLFMVKDVSDNGDVWVELSHDGIVLKDAILNEGDAFDYSHSSIKILSITLDGVYYGPEGELITFVPVYQYIDPALPAPVVTDPVNPIEDINSSSGNNETSENDTPGFSLMLTISAILFMFVLRTSKYSRKK